MAKKRKRKEKLHIKATKGTENIFKHVLASPEERQKAIKRKQRL